MTPYQVLGLVPGASLDEIKAAYRRRMMQCHPDKGGSEEEAKMINRAYEQLTKPQLQQPPLMRQPTGGVYVRVVFTSAYGTTTNTTSTGWTA